jgi:hypothetical protein
MATQSTTPRFTAGQFRPTQFHSADDKARFANQFVRFVVVGFKRTMFPKWFYKRLSNTFGHIAHYNQDGFYAAQCEGHKERLAFLRQAAEFGCYGSPESTFCDVERALQSWIRRSGIMNRLQR